MYSNYFSNSFIYQSSKVPLSTKRSFSKPKQSLFSNNYHTHISSQSTPFCKKCGSIFHISEYNTKTTTSLKPKYLNYKPEISQLETFKHLQKQIQLQTFPEFHLTNDKNINTIRKRMITRMRKYKDKSKMSRSSLYLGIFLMDILIIKDKAFSFHKIEPLAIGSYRISMKYIEMNITITSIKQFQLNFENASVYSCEQISKLEGNILKKLNYKLDYISFFHVIQLLLINGIVFNSDNISDKTTSIYFLVHQICDIVLENGLHYLKYNPLLIACAIIALARKLSDQDKWPVIFNELYFVNESTFHNEYEFVYEIYMSKTQMVKVTPKIKITRNAVYNTNNNLYKMKHNGFFNSNNCNVNMHNNQLLKKIFNNRKMFSKSMEMTHDLSSARNASTNQRSKSKVDNNNNNNHSHTGLRKTCSKDNSKESNHNKDNNRRLSDNFRHYIKIDNVNRSNNIKVCSAKKEEKQSSSVERYSYNIRKIKYNNNTHIKSTGSSHSHSRAGNNHYHSNNNIYHFHMSSNIKDNKIFYNNNINHINDSTSNNGKEHFSSLNSSYCTATETVNGIANNSMKIYNKKSNSISNHKNIQDYRTKLISSSKRIKNKKSGVNNIPYPINFSQSFHKKTNNETHNNTNDILNHKTNHDNNIYSNDKKDVLKGKIDIIEEMAINKLQLISNKVKRITKKQTSLSTQRLAQINNGNKKNINERKRRRIRDIFYPERK